MGNQDLINRLRRMTGEDDVSKYTSTDMQIYLDEAGGDLNQAAATIWDEKASAYADLVNISESGSSRSNSDLFDHAVEQRKRYQGLVDAASPSTDAGQASTTRAIVRA